VLRVEGGRFRAEGSGLRDIRVESTGCGCANSGRMVWVLGVGGGVGARTKKSLTTSGRERSLKVLKENEAFVSVIFRLYT